MALPWDGWIDILDLKGDLCYFNRNSLNQGICSSFRLNKEDTDLLQEFRREGYQLAAAAGVWAVSRFLVSGH